VYWSALLFPFSSITSAYLPACLRHFTSTGRKERKGGLEPDILNEIPNFTGSVFSSFFYFLFIHCGRCGVRGWDCVGCCRHASGIHADIILLFIWLVSPSAPVKLWYLAKVRWLPLGFYTYMVVDLGCAWVCDLVYPFTFVILMDLLVIFVHVFSFCVVIVLHKGLLNYVS
jgi:hypothetical protein